MLGQWPVGTETNSWRKGDFIYQFNSSLGTSAKQVLVSILIYEYKEKWAKMGGMWELITLVSENVEFKVFISYLREESQ